MKIIYTTENLRGAIIFVNKKLQYYEKEISYIINLKFCNSIEDLEKLNNKIFDLKEIDRKIINIIIKTYQIKERK